VLLAFSLSNAITHESGLLTVTVMGIALGNMRGVHIDDILDFKENLTTLLVSSLFILLAARLSWPLPDGMLGAGIAIFIVAQLIVRPVTATIASIGSTLNWRERALIAWIAPRGIVAAAVSALFALKLDALGMEGAKALVPLVFILIIGTVVLQSATARPLARWLKVAEPDPTGVLIYGADQAARVVARALADAGFQVIVADEHWDSIKLARMEGLQTFFGYPASAYAERHLDREQGERQRQRREQPPFGRHHGLHRHGARGVARHRHLDAVPHHRQAAGQPDHVGEPLAVPGEVLRDHPQDDVDADVLPPAQDPRRGAHGDEVEHGLGDVVAPVEAAHAGDERHVAQQHVETNHHHHRVHHDAGEPGKPFEELAVGRGEALERHRYFASTFFSASPYCGLALIAAAQPISFAFST